jgi:hypothetical protein
MSPVGRLRSARSFERLGSPAMKRNQVSMFHGVITSSMIPFSPCVSQAFSGPSIGDGPDPMIVRRALSEKRA